MSFLLGKGITNGSHEQSASIFLAKHVPSGSHVAVKLIHLELVHIDFNLIHVCVKYFTCVLTRSNKSLLM